MKAYKDPGHKARMTERRERQKQRNYWQGTPDNDTLRNWVAFWKAQHAKSIPGGERRKRQRAMDELIGMDQDLY
jgi:hypothetical protein